MFDAKLEWCGPAALDPAESAKAAAWLHSMDRDYYDLFGLEDARIEAKLAELWSTPESEFGTTIFVRRAGVLVGFVAWFFGEELFARRFFVLKSLLADVPDPLTVRAKLKKFEGAHRQLPSNSLYLSKIYVDFAMRGTGLSAQLFERFLEQGRHLGRNLCLHVSRQNVAAIALYSRYDFHIHADLDQSKHLYFLMVCHLQEVSRNELP